MNAETGELCAGRVGGRGEDGGDRPRDALSRWERSGCAARQVHTNHRSRAAGSKVYYYTLLSITNNTVVFKSRQLGAHYTNSCIESNKFGSAPTELLYYNLSSAISAAVLAVAVAERETRSAMSIAITILTQHVHRVSCRIASATSILNHRTLRIRIRSFIIIIIICARSSLSSSSLLPPRSYDGSPQTTTHPYFAFSLTFKAAWLSFSRFLRSHFDSDWTSSVSGSRQANRMTRVCSEELALALSSQCPSRHAAPQELFLCIIVGDRLAVSEEVKYSPTYTSVGAERTVFLCGCYRSTQNGRDWFCHDTLFSA